MDTAARPAPLAGAGRDWIPTIVAVALAAGMLWLAGAPFDSWVEPGAPGATLELVAPGGDRAEFPDRFEWRPVPGADVYEVSVVRLESPRATTGTLVFRQRGASPVLEVDVAGDAGPGPGRYVWEVRAWSGDRPLAAGRAAFRVVPPATPVATP